MTATHERLAQLYIDLHDSNTALRDWRYSTTQAHQTKWKNWEEHVERYRKLTAAEEVKIRDLHTEILETRRELIDAGDFDVDDLVNAIIALAR